MEREKKECILVAAAKAFSRFGFKKASIDEIAKNAGVAKGTVYLACDSKEDLFYQSLHREVRHWIAEVSKVIDPRLPAEDLLKLAAMTGLEYLRSHPLAQDLLLGATQLPVLEWGDKLEELKELGTQNIKEILTIGVRQGTFRQELDIAEVSRLLQDVMLTTYIHYGHRPDAGDRLQRRIVVGYDLVLNGLVVRAPATHHSDLSSSKKDHDERTPARKEHR
jgi:AcrR family transcriptional regulator